MLFQEELIARVRRACAADDGLDAALMYGSFAAGEADQYSDIEFWLFFAPERLAAIDPHAWCSAIAPLTYGLLNEYGSYVAFFPGLVRGEFHFAAAEDIARLADWPARGAPVERMVVVDRRGALEPALRALPQRFDAPVDRPAEALAEYCDGFANWLLLALHLTRRGEHLRAWDALGHLQRHLVWMARLAERSAGHWLTPSRGAERELSPTTLAELRAATGAATPEALPEVLRHAFRLGVRLWRDIAARGGRTVPAALVEELAAALGEPVP
ncbi:hypothetical protein [Actinacidiphila yeochonensis]|uniref:hypothetical protein n=1 Tax=Actinacidiphila yeochonensis TaxID=89050 RepID=UPI00055A1E10|nr:hypothetical protein [Actinacidiphila yeochonensis]